MIPTTGQKRQWTGAVQDASRIPAVAVKRASVLECGGPPPLYPLNSLKDDNLSFINKKYLTNEVDGYIQVP
jgi:hypothetical protein